MVRLRDLFTGYGLLQRSQKRRAAGGIFCQAGRRDGRPRKLFKTACVQGLPEEEQWAETAIFIDVDEDGGYYESGLIQPLDLFEDGPRIPLIAISPFSKGGRPRFVHRAELASCSGRLAAPGQLA
jgi:hypothetical protein